MNRTAAGILAGLIAGLAMSIAMMLYQVAIGHSLWTMPNLIAAMWYGSETTGKEISTATLAGFLTHMATSAAMGWVAIPFIRDLSPRRTLLAALAYGLGSYPVVFALVLTWANPVMVERARLVPMTLAHALFGLVLGASWLRLRRSGSLR